MTIVKRLGVDRMRIGQTKKFRSKGVLASEQIAIHNYGRSHGRKFRTSHMVSGFGKYSGLSVTRTQ